MRLFSWLLAAAAIALLAVGWRVWDADAAPAPKHVDQVVGELDLADEYGPSVYVAGDGFLQPARYWLVFLRTELDDQVRKLEPGTRVRVRGRSGIGGSWQYMVVESVTKDGE